MPANQRAVKTPGEVFLSPSEAPVQAEPKAPSSGDSKNIPFPAVWPRVDSEEIARRAKAVDAAVSFPYRRKPVSSVRNSDAPNADLQRPSRPSLVVVPSQPDKRVLRWAKANPSFSAMVERVRCFAGTTWLSIRVRASQFRVIAHEKFPSSPFSRLFSRVRDLFADAWDRMGMLSKYEVKIRIQSDAPLFLRRIPELIPSWIVAVGSALRSNKRFRTSILIGGLSATLALIAITGLRPNYADPRNGASKNGAPNQSIRAVVGGNATASRSPVVGARSAQGKASAPPNNTAASKDRVTRRSSDDDYVAKDTYVYYGPAGKPPSRR